MSSIVVSIRIPRELKEKLEELNINVSGVTRKLLEEYVEEVEIKILEENLKNLREKLAGKIDPATIARLIREDRSRR